MQVPGPPGSEQQTKPTMAQPSAVGAEGPVSNVALSNLRAPATITHCVSAHLLLPESSHRPANLIVAKGSMLEVYEVATHGNLEGDDRIATLETAKLITTESLHLYGIVESLAVLRPNQASIAGGAGRDALLVALREARAVVCAWDARRGALAVTALHSWEGRPDLTDGRVSFPRGPLARADPQGRCAAVLLFHNRLAILPPAAAEEEGMEPGPEGALHSSGDLAPVLAPAPSSAASYVINLAKRGIHEPRDVCFIGGSSGPVALVLHESLPAWSGSLHERKDTCMLTAIAIGGAKERPHPVLWTCRALPSDALALLPVPEPLGGALVLTPDLVLYRSQAQHTAGAATLPGLIVNARCLPQGNNPRARQAAHLNPNMSAAQAQAAAAFFGNQEDPFAPLTAEEEAQVRAAALKVAPDGTPECLRECARAPPEVDVVLDAPRACCWLDASRALLSTASGSAIMITLEGEVRAIRALSAAKVAALPAAPAVLTTLAPAPPLPSRGEGSEAPRAGLIFAGAPAGDSLLLRYALLSEEQGAEAGEDADAPPSKKARREETEAAPMKDEDEDDVFAIYEMALGASSAAKPRIVKCRLRPADRLAGWGTVRDACLGDMSATVANPALQARLQEDPFLRQGVFQALGGPRGGAVGLTRPSLVPEPLGPDLPLSGIEGLWAVPLASALSLAPLAREEEGGLDFSMEAEEDAGPSDAPMPAFAARADLLPAEQHALSDGPSRHGLLVMGWRKGEQQQLRTFDLRGGGGFQDVTSFFALSTASPTIAVGSLGGGALIAHGTRAGVDLVQGRDGKQVQSLGAADIFQGRDTAVADVLVSDPHVLVLGVGGAAALLSLNPADQRLTCTPYGSDRLYAAAALLRSPRTAVLEQGMTAVETADASAPDVLYLALAPLAPSGDVELWRMEMNAAPTFTGTLRSIGQGGECFLADRDEARRSGAEPSASSSAVQGLRLSSFGSDGSPFYAAQEALKGILTPAVFLSVALSDGTVSVFKLAASLDRQLRPTVLARRHFSLHTGSDRRAAPLVQCFHRLRAAGRKGLLHEGIFIGGARPHWLLYSGRGVLVPHPMISEGPVTAWSPLNCSALPAASVASVDRAQRVRFLQLPPHPWELLTPGGGVGYQVPLDPRPVVPVPSVPLRIAYYPEGGLACLGVLKKGDVARLLPKLDEEVASMAFESGREPRQATAYLTAQAMLQEGQREDVHELQLLDVASGSVIFRDAMSPMERIASVAAVRLFNQAEKRSQPLIAVGTVRPLGGDTYSMGRLLIYEARQVASPEGPVWDVRRLAEREDLHGFTAIEEVDGNIMAAAGTFALNCNTVKFFMWNGSNLVEGSFYNPDKPRYMAPTYVTKLAVIRPQDGIPVRSLLPAAAADKTVHFSLMADVMGSLHVLCLPLGHAGRVVLAEYHDHALVQTLSCEALADERIPGSTTFLAADPAGVLRVHRPFQASTLLLQGATYTGSALIAMDRWRRPGRSAVLMAGSDGSLRLASLVPEDIAAILRSLMQHLGSGNAFAPALGLNPRGFFGSFEHVSAFEGGMKQCWATGKRAQRKVPPPESIVDLSLIEQMCSLPTAKQDAVSRAAGLGEPSATPRHDALAVIASAVSWIGL